MRALIVSDVHLVNLEDRKGRHFFSFLKAQAENVDRIYVLGDLFDVWPGTSSRLIERFQPLWDFFSGFIGRGGQVHYVEGNHDFQLGKSLSKKFGIKVYTDQIEDEWNGVRVLLVHGDAANLQDLAYLRLRRFFRSPWFLAIRKALPDRFSLFVGDTASRFSRETQLKQPDQPQKLAGVRARYRQIAQDIFKTGKDIVVMGHTHVPDDFQVELDGRTCRYLNSGDWVKNYTFIAYDSGNFELLSHPA
jgi:UDP-2,3-diacylglucosamine hydrolase